MMGLSKENWSALEDDFRTFLLTAKGSDSTFQEVTALNVVRPPGQ
jgi:hypothetical protein